MFRIIRIRIRDIRMRMKKTNGIMKMIRIRIMMRSIMKMKMMRVSREYGEIMVIICLKICI